MGLSLIVAERAKQDTDPARADPAARCRERDAGSGYSRRVIAFLPTLGFGEMVVLVAIGILLFGRNLPDVGRQIGRTVAQLKRGMQEFKDQMNRDESLRDLRDTVRDTRNEIARAGTVPRAIANPGAALQEMAREAINGSEGEASAEAARQSDVAVPQEPTPAAPAPAPAPPAEQPDAKQSDRQPSD
jgi:Sec-independent protein translocase protein TatA